MRRFLTVCEYTAAFFLLAIALLTFSNVLLRDLAGVQIPDWFDLSKQLQAIAVFWGIALATYRGGHICVDILWEQVRASNRRRIDLFATICTLAFLTPMAWMVWSKLEGAGGQATSDLRLPLVPFFAVSALGATAAAVLAAARIVRLWRGTEEEPTGLGAQP